MNVNKQYNDILNEFEMHDGGLIYLSDERIKTIKEIIAGRKVSDYPKCDANNSPYKNGDIIDIGQTVNGQSKFLIVDIERLDIRYLYDTSRKYEYDCADLLRTCPETLEGPVIIKNVFEL
jgi:hypothetical protein